MDERICRQTSDNVASRQNAASDFRKADMWSLTIYVFQDSDIAAATVTNILTEAA